MEPEKQSHASIVQITLFQCSNCNFSTTRISAFHRGTKITSDMMGSYEVPALVCPVCGIHLDDGR